MNSHGLVELDPLGVRKLLRISAITTVGEATNGRLSAWESFLMLLFELAHVFLGEYSEAIWSNSHHAHYEALYSQNGSCEYDVRILLWNHDLEP